MTSVFDFTPGEAPLLVSMPHSGLALPEGMEGRLSPKARSLPDTDWDVPELYDFLDELGASVIRARYSRFVVDLNRDPSGQSLYPGQATTGLVPTELFDGEAIYQPGDEPDADEITVRTERYFRPYHNQLQSELNAMTKRHGFALLWDAHSIASRVPRLFSGALPDLNLGSYSGRSCARDVEQAVVTALSSQQAFSTIANGRFKGGWITRRYGDPAGGVHALQMEIGQDAYCDRATGRIDETRAQRLRPVLKSVIRAALDAAQRLHTG